MGSIRTVSRKGGVSFVARIHRRGEETMSKTFRDKSEARKWINSTEAGIDKKEKVSRTSETMRFKELCDEFIKAHKKVTADVKGPSAGTQVEVQQPRRSKTKFDRATTLANGEESMVNILPQWFPKEFNVADITRNHVLAFIPTLMAATIPEPDGKKKTHPLYNGDKPRTYSGNTARKYYFQLKKVLVWGSIKYKFPLEASLFEGIPIPGSWENPRDRRLEGDEELRLIATGKRSQANGEQWPLLIGFAIETAARTQEILLAQWKEIDIEGRAWNIPKEHVKTDEARQVPLSKNAIEILKSLNGQRNSVKNAAKIGADKPSSKDVQRLKSAGEELLFTAWKDSLALSKAFKRLIKRAEIPDLHFHDLRHEGISRMVIKKLSDVQIMKITGHTNASTMARYAKLRASDIAHLLD